MSVATGSNFIEGNGTIDDPFAAGARPLTLAEQAAAKDAERARLREEQRSTDTRVANTNRAADIDPGRRVQLGSSIDPRTGKPYPKHAKVDNSLSGILKTGNDLVEDHPWVVAMPLAPLAGASLAPAAGAGSSGTIAGGGAAAGGEAIVPVANEATGLATAGPGFSAEAANAYNAAATGNAVASSVPAVAGATTPAAAGASGLTGGEAFMKYGVPALTSLAPLGINALTGGRTKEEKALLAKQEQMAKEAEARRFQVQESRMNALGQQLLAINPRNQMMAKMFGPDAAFAPTDFAQMVQNPVPPPQMPPELQALAGKNTKNTPQQEAAFRAFAQQKQQYEQGNQARADQMMNGMAPPGPGPAPLQSRTPQAARKY